MPNLARPSQIDQKTERQVGHLGLLKEPHNLALYILLLENALVPIVLIY